MNSRFVIISAAIAGTLAALASNTPLLSAVNCLLCGWLWLGGILAVWIYRWNVEEPLTRGGAMIIGVVTGLIAAGVHVVIAAIEGMNAAPLPEATMAQLRQAIGPSADFLFSAGSSLIVTAVFVLIFYTLFGMLGGLLSTLIFKAQAQGPQA